VIHSHKHRDKEKDGKNEYPQDFEDFPYFTQEVFSKVFPEDSAAALLLHALMVHH
jgi:hypothetical protein